MTESVCPGCHHEQAEPWCRCAGCREPRVLSQRYELDAVLGRGGMGAVYRAKDRRGGPDLAVKQLLLEGDGWKGVELAERGARVLASLKHAGLPSVTELLHDEQGLFLVHELLEGGSLQQRVEQGCRLDPEEFEALLRSLLGTLGYLHSRLPPVLHRDVKPSNVLFRSQQSWAPVLVDFDTVAAPPGAGDGLTLVGTPGFMAPEQMFGRSSPAGDLYSAGATLLFAVTHVPPERWPRVAGERVALQELLPGLDGRLRRALAGLLEPDVTQRYAHAEAAVADLDAPSPAPMASIAPALKSAAPSPAPVSPAAPSKRRPTRAPAVPKPARRAWGVRHVLFTLVLLGLHAGISLGAFALESSSWWSADEPIVLWLGVAPVFALLLGLFAQLRGRRLKIAAALVVQCLVTQLLGMALVHPRIFRSILRGGGYLGDAAGLFGAIAGASLAAFLLGLGLHHLFAPRGPGPAPDAQPTAAGLAERRPADEVP